MPRFNTPIAFLILFAIPFVLYFYFKKNKIGIKFSSTARINTVGQSWKQKLIVLPVILRVLVLVFLTLAIARPQMGKEMIRDISKGIAIEMVVDRSGSMRYMKDINRKSMSRLDIVKKAFKEFVAGNNKNLKGRPNDLIGMITFARYADTVCPLTLSHNALLQFIENMEIVKIQSENATSIGDGIALAAARLRTAEESLDREKLKDNVTYEIKSKIIILLTDGEDSGIGKRTPLQAARLAAEWGIKIYTIGLSGKGWYEIIEDSFFGRQKRFINSYINSAILEKIAKETGGIFRVAEDIDSLRDIYIEINNMEKSEIESVRYLDYKELFMPFALIALLLLLAEILLSATIFRRIP